MPHKVDILLVEDNANDAELTMRALRHNKIVNDILLAEDGVEALDILFCRDSYKDRSFSNPPKLVLLDLKLPKISGMEVLKKLKSDSRTAKIPIVILTSSIESNDLKRCYEMGANSYIVKPYDLEDFTKAVSTAGLYWLVINEGMK